MEIHEREVIDGSRKLDERFNELFPDAITKLYKQWSNENNCNNWTTYTPGGIKAFCEWAFNSPFELIKKERE